jgi:hypothetical protein
MEGRKSEDVIAKDRETRREETKVGNSIEPGLENAASNAPKRETG